MVSLPLKEQEKECWSLGSFILLWIKKFSNDYSLSWKDSDLGLKKKIRGTQCLEQEACLI